MKNTNSLKTKLPTEIKTSFKRRPYGISEITKWLQAHGRNVHIGYAGYGIYTIHEGGGKRFVDGAELIKYVLLE